MLLESTPTPMGLLSAHLARAAELVLLGCGCEKLQFLGGFSNQVISVILQHFIFCPGDQSQGLTLARYRYNPNPSEAIIEGT